MTLIQQHDPQIVQRSEQPYVSIPIQVPMKEWGQANALVGEIFQWLEQQGLELAGPPFFRYWVIGDMEKAFELEVGAPLASAAPGDGRVQAGAIPGGTYAMVTHQGHPDRMDQTHAALQEWAADQGLNLSSSRADGESVWHGRFEFFLTNPAEEPDPENWTMEILYLVQEERITQSA